MQFLFVLITTLVGLFYFFYMLPMCSKFEYAMMYLKSKRDVNNVILYDEFSQMYNDFRRSNKWQHKSIK